MQVRSGGNHPGMTMLRCIAHWLRAQGEGYQSRINAILRREMLQSFTVKAVKQG